METRSPERLRHHYEVEKELAARLRASSRDERPQLFPNLYRELFNRVPDHPRLTRMDSAEASRRNVEAQMRLLRPFIKPGGTFVEFAPGDCRLSHEVCKTAGKVIGVDISDQRSSGEISPENFQLIVYNGYDLNVPSGVADVVFSYQFLEHLHPDDVPLHFEQANRLLKPGGCYVFDTPHRLSGPHDISKYFGHELNCFHFQEWTYGEMEKLLHKHGFGKNNVLRIGRRWKNRLLLQAINLGEKIIESLPFLRGGNLVKKLFPAVTLASYKTK